MTPKQQKVVRAAVRAAERDARNAADMHERMVNAFGGFAFKDRGTLMESAKRTDDAARHAKNLRQLAENAGIEIDAELLR